MGGQRQSAAYPQFRCPFQEKERRGRELLTYRLPWLLALMQSPSRMTSRKHPRGPGNEGQSVSWLGDFGKHKRVNQLGGRGGEVLFQLHCTSCRRRRMMKHVFVSFKMPPRARKRKRHGLAGPRSLFPRSSHTLTLPIHTPPSHRGQASRS